MRLGVILAVLVVANLAIFAAKASASRPADLTPIRQHICFLGHVGQPSGCRWI
jgi:hypothetical protein